VAYQLISASAAVDTSVDPKSVLATMDRCSVDAAVVVPLPVECGVADANDRLVSFCATDPERLWGVAQLPSSGLAEAVAEARRMAEAPTVAGLLLAAWPNGSLEIEPEDDQLWELASAAGLPLVIRGGLGARALDWRPPSRLEDAVTFADVPGRQVQLLFGGVLQRFTRLQFVMAAADCGWVPYFEYLANDNYLRHSRATLRDRPLPDLPGRMFSGHVSYTMTSDPFAVTNRDRIGVHRMQWSIDLGPDTSLKEVTESLSELAPLGREERHAIVAANALRIYRHPGR